MLCPQCGGTMKIVSVIDEAAVVDRILRHLARIGGNDPHEDRWKPLRWAHVGRTELRSGESGTDHQYSS